MKNRKPVKVESSLLFKRQSTNYPNVYIGRKLLHVDYVNALTHREVSSISLFKRLVIKVGILQKTYAKCISKGCSTRWLRPIKKELKVSYNLLFKKYKHSKNILNGTFISTL
jgi:hypothetical protein